MTNHMYKQSMHVQLDMGIGIGQKKFLLYSYVDRFILCNTLIQP